MEDEESTRRQYTGCTTRYHIKPIISTCWRKVWRYQRGDQRP